MAVIDTVLKINENNTLSFGNYLVKEKQKVYDIPFNNDIYKCKTHTDITRLEKNDKLLIETAPGATVHNFKYTNEEVTFELEGHGDTKFTIELIQNQEYSVSVDNKDFGTDKTNLSGKFSFSYELLNTPVEVKIKIKK